MGMREQLKTGGQKSKEKYANHCKRGNKNKSSLSYLTPLHCKLYTLSKSIVVIGRLEKKR